MAEANAVTGAGGALETGAADLPRIEPVRGVGLLAMRLICAAHAEGYEVERVLRKDPDAGCCIAVLRALDGDPGERGGKPPRTAVYASARAAGDDDSLEAERRELAAALLAAAESLRDESGRIEMATARADLSSGAVPELDFRCYGDAAARKAGGEGGFFDDPADAAASHTAARLAAHGVMHSRGLKLAHVTAASGPGWAHPMWVYASEDRSRVVASFVAGSRKGLPGRELGAGDREALAEVAEALKRAAEEEAGRPVEAAASLMRVHIAGGGRCSIVETMAGVD